ncbi:DUF2789 domain-containing protein [Marinibactrum halimedae]|uniref:DUF2789 domain-containing protein n=1 Tax=Marinibactrum halimedae TaxID=1444977 RepID=A0AA37WLT9_9GAMM|nr:DUF2789 domain-containing protein [Marinibactrum halimedae]MCD9460171.1 DUF2789 domain-containing protein [Marinibactrum halimedae]GLS26359.1 hypothetical protein GCM10007877_20740 [Marinibactrum halimedae]
MDMSVHSMSSLFEQLGLASDETAIDKFISAHRIPHELKITQAQFWSPSQVEFLKEALESDSDWTEWVDLLDARMRE